MTQSAFPDPVKHFVINKQMDEYGLTLNDFTGIWKVRSKISGGWQEIQNLQIVLFLFWVLK